MKKLLLLLALFAVTAQVSAQKRFSVGLKAGLNLSDLYIDAEGIDPSEVRGVKPAFMAGVLADYRFLPHLSLSGEVLYSRQGSQSDWFDRESTTGHATESLEIDYLLHYLNIPVLLNYYPIRDAGFAISTGVQFGMLLDAKFKTNWTDGTKREKTDENITSDLYRFDVSIPLGLSYTFDYGFFVDARYHFSLHDLMKNDAKAALEPEGVVYRKMKNRLFTLSVGWKF